MRPFLAALITLIIVDSVQSIEPYLVHVGDSRFELGETMSTGETAQGSFSYVPITGGWLNISSLVTNRSSIASNYDNSDLTARVMSGEDRAQIYGDGSYSLDVSVAAQDLNPPHNLFLVQTTGRVPPGFEVNGTFTSTFGELNAYQILTIVTDSEDYAWLDGAALVGQEQIEVVNSMVSSIDLRIFQVIFGLGP